MFNIRIIYFILLIVCLVLSIFANRKNDRSLIIFPYLLSISIVAEILVYTFHSQKLNHNLIYHLYVPVEYAFLATYFYLNAKNLSVKKVILYSIPAYVFIGIVFSIFTKMNNHPAFLINLEGLFLITWAVVTLFSIDARGGNKITDLPVFWICVAILIYHSGIFTFTGIYNYINEQRTGLGIKLNLYILQISNYILYICLSIAFICSHRTKT